MTDTGIVINAAEWLNMKQELQRQVDKNLMLESELTKYKAAAALNGEGKPIAVGNEQWIFDYAEMKPYAIKIISISESADEKHEYSIHYDDWEVGNRDCYSTAEAVPEGD